jgi:hypothetical protein
MPVKITEDGAYDLSGAKLEDVKAAMEDYYKKTPPENNVFLMDEPKGVIGKVREKLRDFTATGPVRDFTDFVSDIFGY